MLINVMLIKSKYVKLVNKINKEILHCANYASRNEVSVLTF